VVDDRRFFRSQDRILGGVCAGLAEGFHLDPLWVRILFIVLVFVQGVGIFLYVVLWLVMSERVEGGATRSGFDSMTADLRRISGDVQRQFGTGNAGSSAATTTTTSSDSRPQPAWQRQPSILGLILVVIGLLILGTNIGVINWAVVWPAALITIGIVLLVRNMERRS